MTAKEWFQDTAETVGAAWDDYQKARRIYLRALEDLLKEDDGVLEQIKRDLGKSGVAGVIALHEFGTLNNAGRENVEDWIASGEFQTLSVEPQKLLKMLCSYAEISEYDLVQAADELESVIIDKVRVPLVETEYRYDDVEGWLTPPTIISEEGNRIAEFLEKMLVD